MRLVVAVGGESDGVLARLWRHWVLARRVGVEGSHPSFINRQPKTPSRPPDDLTSLFKILVENEAKTIGSKALFGFTNDDSYLANSYYLILFN
jgi:hypothetical protein